MEFEGHFYSAPHALIHERVDIRATEYVIEVLHRGQRVASHMRSSVRGKHTTFAAHMPKAHQKHLEWTPSRIVRWAESIGPKTLPLAEAILAERKHPEQGYRSCLGIFRLGKKYSPERLEAACSRALDAGARSYRHERDVANGAALAELSCDAGNPEPFCVTTARVLRLERRHGV